MILCCVRGSRADLYKCFFSATFRWCRHGSRDAFEAYSHVGHSRQEVAAHEMLHGDSTRLPFFEVKFVDRKDILIEAHSLSVDVAVLIGEAAQGRVALSFSPPQSGGDAQSQSLEGVGIGGRCAHADAEAVAARLVDRVDGKDERIRCFPSVHRRGAEAEGFHAALPAAHNDEEQQDEERHEASGEHLRLAAHCCRQLGCFGSVVRAAGCCDGRGAVGCCGVARHGGRLEQPLPGG